MAKRWRIHAHEPERIAALAHSLGVSAVVAQLLVCRGLVDPQRGAAVSRLPPVGPSRPRTTAWLPRCGRARARGDAERQTHRTLRRLRRRRDDWHCAVAAMPEAVGRERRLLFAPSHRGRLRIALRGHPSPGRREGGDAGDRRLRDHQRPAGSDSTAVRRGTGDHRPSPAGVNVAGGFGHCPSGASRRASEFDGLSGAGWR